MRSTKNPLVCPGLSLSSGSPTEFQMNGRQCEKQTCSGLGFTHHRILCPRLGVLCEQLRKRWLCLKMAMLLCGKLMINHDEPSKFWHALCSNKDLWFKLLTSFKAASALPYSSFFLQQFSRASPQDTLPIGPYGAVSKNHLTNCYPAINCQSHREWP